ncbi:DNA primase catalytic subunit PriS [Halobaculum sp. MBLA0143]|uniref:DNA primase catalytic subunit PriS n=1 Tax=Halobaculum sp. MBLA0143 TaxID=3079933 RepID=UPI003523C566
MERRTRSYLAGRFGDYYRGRTVTPPPDADHREWGHIPFTGGEGTTMVRHQSLLDVAGGPAELGSFLARETPRHVYFSAARYDDPSNRTMADKGWQGADLVFDLDADHLPGVDPETTSYPAMLHACKEALQDLLDVLVRDFGFRDDQLQVVFSGGRGYHVHVRDDSVAGLDSEARREIVDYVRGLGLDEDGLIEKRPNERGTLQKTLRAEGGWGRRVHDRLLSYTERLRELPEEAALAELQELDGVGEKTARTIYGVLQNNPEGVRAGNVELGPGAGTLVRALADRVVDEETAPIDEPVTTDVRRLIRLPGSLHGGTGFVVRRLDRDAVADFEPTRDAVADRFRGQRIMIDVTDPGPVPVGADADDSFTIAEGTRSVREFVGVFLLARGRAEKTAE